MRIFDGFADLFAGRIVDKTNTRWGRFRPYLLFAAIPLLLLNIAVFSVPDLGDTARLSTPTPPTCCSDSPTAW